MENNVELKIVTKENEYLKKMLDDNLKATSDLSDRWIKLYKTFMYAFCITILVITLACGYVCRMYLVYAYDTDSMEKQNTNTNINKNINENTNK